MSFVLDKLIKNWAIIIITIVGFILRISAIFIDPFLHPWDERFHALVARNMMDHPLVPILRVHPITENYDHFIWCCNHIWLHKQPLFMWQMALSMKIFGVSEWSMRLPSALMGTLLILLLYRIVIILTSNKRIALFAAILLAFSNFHLKLIAGIHGMDHDDVAHGFYVLASIWALCEYKKSNKWYWVVLIGIFSGAAILNKWLTGLLVFLMWGIMLLFSMFKEKNVRHEILFYMLSVLVCCFIFLPWQISILSRFPELAKYEYAFNREHLTKAIEGHGGGYFYYFGYLNDLFGQILFYLIPIGIFLSIKIETIRKHLNYGIMVTIVFVFLFYSIVVKSKVDTYLFFIAPLAMIYIAVALDSLIILLSKRIKPWMSISFLVIVISFLSLRPIWIGNYLSLKNLERNDRIYNANIYRNLKKFIPDNVKVVMNMNSFEDVDVMFYNKGITAYHWTLSEEDFKDFEKRKLPIAVFETHGNYKLPEYVLKYPYLYIIKKELRNF